jgi:hypothetical protein
MIYATGATNVEGPNYRIDGLAQHSDGFRHLEDADYELRPAFTWSWSDHVTTAALDLRHIVQTPDLYGIPYVGGAPLGVPRDSGYSTPFGHGDRDIERLTLTDAWWWSNELTINNRFSYMHRDLDILRNSGGATISGEEMTSRQLREQSDHDDDLIYQFEPACVEELVVSAERRTTSRLTGKALKAYLDGEWVWWQINEHGYAITITVLEAQQRKPRGSDQWLSTKRRSTLMFQTRKAVPQPFNMSPCCSLDWVSRMQERDGRCTTILLTTCRRYRKPSEC